MKSIVIVFFAGLSALMLAACGAPATDTNPGGAAMPAAAAATPAAPTADALFALEKQANAAYVKADSMFFEDLLSDKFIMHEGGQRMDKSSVVKMIGGVKCDVTSWNLDEPRLAKIDADTYALSYRGTWDGTCTGPDGESMKIPSPVRAATVWVRNGDSWQAAFHGENVIVDPDDAPAPQAPLEARKETPKHEEQAAVGARATGDNNTDALMKVELAVWEAWRAKDAKKLDELTANDISFVNIFGTYFATKADTMKDWTEGKCEISGVNVSEGVANALSPTVEMLTLKGTADGACDGQRVSWTVYGTTVYVKEGDAWKWTFGMNMPAK